MVKTRLKVNKIMRDKMPSVFKHEGVNSSSTHVPAESLMHHMCMKLEEETDELIHFCHDKEMSKEEKTKMVKDEIADVIQVLMGIAKEHHISWEEVEKYRVHKLSQKGGFEKGTHVDWIEIEEDHEKMHRYHANPHYPAIHKEHGKHHAAGEHEHHSHEHDASHKDHVEHHHFDHED